MMDVNERLAFFRELITCAHDITFSTFNSSFQNIFCNNDMVDALYIFLSIDDLDTLNQMPLLSVKHSTKLENISLPAICTNSLGMLWISECEYNNNVLERIHVIGPVFTTDYSPQQINQRIDNLHLPLSMKKNFLRFIESLPVIPIIRMYEYGCMLHYCLYNERIATSDLVYLNPSKKFTASDNPHEAVAPEQTYLATKNLLDMVETGNLEYQKSMNQLTSVGYIAKNSDDFLRQAQNAVIVLTALCCHAAIRGGLSPSTAYLLSDHYLQEVENCSKVSSLGEISKLMLQDYTQRVYRLKCTNSSVSPQIQSVCDRLALHPETTPAIHTLAAELGYSEYYFSRKFHQETGITVKEYLLQKKIEKSKELLKNTSMSIQDIAESLGFCSPSYFGKLFKKSVGMSPGEFRQ